MSNSKLEHSLSVLVSPDGKQQATLTFSLTNIGAGTKLQFLNWGGVLPEQPKDAGEIFFSKPNQPQPELMPSKVLYL